MGQKSTPVYTNPHDWHMHELRRAMALVRQGALLGKRHDPVDPIWDELLEKTRNFSEFGPRLRAVLAAQES